MSLDKVFPDGEFTSQDIPFSAAQCSECGAHAVEFGECTACGAEVSNDYSTPEIVLEE